MKGEGFRVRLATWELLSSWGVRSRICLTLEQRPARIGPDPASMLVCPWLWMSRTEPQAAAALHKSFPDRCLHAQDIFSCVSVAETAG